jgi:mono/diheme cytochrome c family protein
MKILVLLVIIGVMVAIRFVATRFVTLNRLAWIAIWWVALYLMLILGVDPPLPSSIVVMFMAIITIALLAYLSADSEQLAVAKGALTRFMTEKRYTVPLLIVLVALPLLVAVKVYFDLSAPPRPAVAGRTIHPPPPTSISFQGQTIDLVQTHNPYRALEESDPASFATHVENGRRLYYENCFYCHGDNMSGDGHFAHGYDPIPANFNDASTIAILQETYLFWRIAKGAPGLPEEATPWASAMPAWENFLTEEEIWDVILFLYEFTDQRPRSSEAEEEAAP